jgi:hypothetical protein
LTTCAHQYQGKPALPIKFHVALYQKPFENRQSM